MHGVFASIASLIRPHIFHIAFVIVTCALVVAETYMHAAVRRVIRNYHFIIRVSVYVFMFAFVYAFLVAFFGPRLAHGLASLNDEMLIGTLLAIFVIFGILVERK